MTSSVSNLDDVISLATSARGLNDPSIVANALKAFLRKDITIADTALAVAGSGGQDPLGFLNPAQHTIAYLYILGSRLQISPANVPAIAITNFCKSANPLALRYVPEAVTRFGISVFTLADMSGNIRDAVGPLRDLLLRYPESLAHLTSIHPLFVRACIKAQYYTFALPVIETPITEINKKAYDLSYNVSLAYHYAAAICFAALKRFREAEECFEIVVSSPAQSTPAALQLDSLNKLSLIQLIIYGKVQPTPKYTHPLLLRIFKAGPYSALAKAYPGTTTQSLLAVAEKEQKAFLADENVGLVRQVLERAPRWQVRKLTETYVTLSVSELGRAVGIESEAEIRALLISMIETREIHATVSAAGTVTFHDAPVTFGKDKIDGLLRDAQVHAQLVAEFDRELERSREFLQRAANSGGREGGAYALDEMDMGMPSMSMRDGMWDEGDY